MVRFNKQNGFGGGGRGRRGGGGWTQFTAANRMYLNAFRKLFNSTKNEIAKLDKTYDRLETLEAMIMRSMDAGHRHLILKCLKLKTADASKERRARFRKLKWNLVTNGNTRSAHLLTQMKKIKKRKLNIIGFQHSLWHVGERMKAIFGVDPGI